MNDVALTPTVVPAAPTPATSTPRSGSARTVCWVLLAGLAILFVRCTDAFWNPQFWAEDGRVYFMTARLEGIRSILRPYEANTYVIHRAIAYAGNFVPVRYAPRFYMLCSLAIMLGVMAYISQARIDMPYRGLMALTIVSVPHTGEVFLLLNNLHWPLAVLMLVMALSTDPKSRAVKLLEAVMLVCMFLDGPFVILFAPLFALRALRQRSRYSLVLVGLAVVGALWQTGLLRSLLPVAGTLTWRYKQTLYPGKGINPWDPAWRSFWGNCLGGVLFLGRYIGETYRDNVWMVLLTAALYLWLAAYGVRWGNWFYFGCFYAICSILGSLAYVYRMQPFYATVSPGFRYSYIPFICTVWMLLFIVAQRGWTARLATALLVMIAMSSLSAFHFQPMPDLHWAEKSRGIGGPTRCIVPVNGIPDYKWAIYYDPDRDPEWQSKRNRSDPAKEQSP